jgi:hypothetical protein
MRLIIAIHLCHNLVGQAIHPVGQRDSALLSELLIYLLEGCKRACIHPEVCVRFTIIEQLIPDVMINPDQCFLISRLLKEGGMSLLE